MRGFICSIGILKLAKLEIFCFWSLQPPGRLTAWTWSHDGLEKMNFLFQDGILRFHVYLPGCNWASYGSQASAPNTLFRRCLGTHPAGSEHKYETPKTIPFHQKQRTLRTCKLAPLWFPQVRELLFLIIPGVKSYVSLKYLQKWCKSTRREPVEGEISPLSSWGLSQRSLNWILRLPNGPSFPTFWVSLHIFHLSLSRI